LAIPFSVIARHSSVMKTLAAGIVWFLASWFLYDITAFILGMPRQVTPLVALAIAITITVALRLASLGRPNVTLRVGSNEPNLPQLN
jgi:putative exporter of polyketide antibiotics